MAAHWSTGKQSWQSTDTRSRWTNATVRPTESGREMSALQLNNTRTRAKQAFVPADPSGRVGLFLCGPTVYDLPHLGHAKAYTQFDFLARLPRTRGFAIVRAEHHRRGRQDHPSGARAADRRVRARAHIRACVSGQHAGAEQRLRERVRAPATTSTKSSARSSACSRRARRHQRAQLDAQLVEIIDRL